MKRVIFAVLLGSLGVPIAAADRSHPDLESCIEEAGPVDLSVRDCYVELAASEDARLNQAWRDLMTVVGGKSSAQGAALLAEQRAWLIYRDAACWHYVSSTPSGTLDRLQQQMCYSEIISQRADYVEELASMYLGMMRAQSED